ncbi:MAG: InlB B-repeat-containing protein, partial [Clostridia bacterium]|nr:InlB B-repeat-containing protein [Clostridia bacterium]
MKKNTLIKLLSIALVCLMLLPTMIACGGGNGGNGEGGGTNEGGNGGTTPPPSSVTVYYEPGEGYFEEQEDYEKVVDYGSRLSAKDHPTPIRDGGYEFAGWYAKEDFSVGIQNSLKYTQDTTYYARWIKLFECSDGSYDHDWGNGWYELTAATCDKGAMMRRECSICMSPQDEQNPTGLGHKWSQWSELGVMQRLRSCERTGCS